MFSWKIGVNNLLSNQCRILAPLKMSCVFKYLSTLPCWGADTEWIIIFWVNRSFRVVKFWMLHDSSSPGRHFQQRVQFFEHFSPQIVLTNSYHLGVCLLLLDIDVKPRCSWRSHTFESPLVSTVKLIRVICPLPNIVFHPAMKCSRAF